jgi:hypothetical protein
LQKDFFLSSAAATNQDPIEVYAWRRTACRRCGGRIERIPWNWLLNAAPPDLSVIAAEVMDSWDEFSQGRCSDEVKK